MGHGTDLERCIISGNNQRIFCHMRIWETIQCNLLILWMRKQKAQRMAHPELHVCWCQSQNSQHRNPYDFRYTPAYGFLICPPPIVKTILFLGLTTSHHAKNMSTITLYIPLQILSQHLFYNIPHWAEVTFVVGEFGMSN